MPVSIYHNAQLHYWKERLILILDLANISNLKILLAT